MNDIEFETLAGFRYALRQFLHRSEENATRAGVTHQQYLALLAIRGYGAKDPMIIAELADRLQLQHHSTVGLVDRLQRQGLIVRRVNPGDKRQVHVLLTDKAHDVLQQVGTANTAMLRTLQPQITALLTALNPRGTK